MSSLPIAAEIVVPKPKRTMLHVLITLLVISYGMLTLLVVEQGMTIENQRSLIHELFGDSAELMGLKAKLAQKHIKVTPGPSAQAPATRAQNQAAPQQDKRQGKARVSDNSAKVRKAAPMKPPKAQEDDPDLRRMNVSI